MLTIYRIKKYHFAFVILIAVALTPGFSQQFKLNTYLDTTAILIGDQLTYTIELEQPRNAKVIFPVLKDTLSSKIEIVETEPADTSRRNELLVIKKRFIITSFDSGYHKIPAYSFAFRLDNHTDSITSSEHFLTVNTLPVDTAKEIMDIKPVMNTPFSLTEIKKELLTGLVILIGIALIIWILIRYKKNKSIFISKKPEESPHIIALRELDRVSSEKLWQNNHIKLFYTRITDILRIYIYGRFGINAMEMTTEEILQSLEMELNTDMDLKASFSKLLILADMVKFAKEVPLPQENEISLLSAYTFVNRTKIEVVNPSEVQISEKTESGKE